MSEAAAMEMDERRARALDLRAAMSDDKAFAEYLKRLTPKH